MSTRMLSPSDLEVELERTNDSVPENKILLLTVLNAVHPINVEIVARVCRAESSRDSVERIVIFERAVRTARGIVQGVQALVEFKSLEAACQVKKSLHGCDIYSNACTLKVEFARQERLNVKRNDDKTWDFSESPILESRNGISTRKRKILITEGPPSSLESKFMGVSMNDMQYPGGGGGMEPMHTQGPGMHMHSQYGDSGMGGMQGMNGSMNGYYQGGQQERQSPVIIIYNLDPERFNCNRLFNLLCLYGNIERINFLKSKEGCAMVEFSDVATVDKVCRNLSQVRIWGARLRLEPSKKSHVEEIRQPHELPDGTDSFQNFYRDRNNRFDTPERAAKNRIMPPMKYLHFYNVPKMTDENLMDIFAEQLAPCPVKVRWFEPRVGSTSKMSNGIVEFESLEDSCEALVTCNNLKVEGEDDNTFDMKLCFSRSIQN